MFSNILIRWSENGKRGIRTLSRYIRRIMENPEGGLIPNRYKKVMEIRVFKYSLVSLLVCLPFSKLIYRLSKVEWIKFPDVVVLFAVFIIILSYMVIVIKLWIMITTFMEMDNDEYVKLGGPVLLGRLALQGIKVATGGLIAFGGIVQGLDTYGNMRGKGPVATEAGKEMFKKLGLYDYGGSNRPNPDSGDSKNKE